MCLDDDVVRQALDRDGFAVVRGLFSPDEIGDMRSEANAVLATSATPLHGGLNSGAAPDTSDLARRLLHDPRLTPLFFDTKNPYTVHVHANTYNNWHRDVDLAYAPIGNWVPWVYKLAIYLEDHVDRGGLSVIPGSHKDRRALPVFHHVSTRAGDVVVFDTRLRHAGQLPNYKERLIRNIGVLLFRAGIVDYRSYQLMLSQFQQFLCGHASVNERLALLVVSTAFQQQAMESFDRWSQDRINARTWRVLRPPPWASVP